MIPDALGHTEGKAEQGEPNLLNHSNSQVFWLFLSYCWLFLAFKEMGKLWAQVWKKDQEQRQRVYSIKKLKQTKKQKKNPATFSSLRGGEAWGPETSKSATGAMTLGKPVCDSWCLSFGKQEEEDVIIGRCFLLRGPGWSGRAIGPGLLQLSEGRPEHPSSHQRSLSLLAPLFFSAQKFPLPPRFPDKPRNRTPASSSHGKLMYVSDSAI